MAAHDPCQELWNYLNAPHEHNIQDPVHWWEVHLFPLFFYCQVKLTAAQYHAHQYPILAHMARDYLAIQGSSVPAECAFSSGGLTGTLLHNSLTPEVFKSLQILKAGYKNGAISAGEVQDHLAIDLTMEDD